MPWCTGCDRFLSPSTVTAAGACPRCGATVDPGRARAPSAAPEAGGSARPATGERTTGARAARLPSGPDPAATDPTTEPVTDDGETPLPVPWHFKLLVGAIALYLGWRAFQGIEWIAGRF